MDTWLSLQNGLGLNVEPKDLTFVQMTFRGVIVFFSCLLMLRLSEKRFLPHKTAFDAALFFVLASMLSRAINGSAAFFPTLGVGFVLIVLHRVLAHLACRFHSIGKLIKGSESLLIQDGKIISESLRRHNLSMEDLLEELRINGNLNQPGEVKEARYERSGEISVVKH